MADKSRSAHLNPHEFGGREGLIGNPPAAPKTNAAPPAPKTNSNRTMVERKAPELYRFQAKGDMVEGILVEIAKVTVGGKPCVQYLIRDHDKSYQILGTYDINSKLFIADKGKYVQIALVGYNEQVSKNGNAMMVFQVNVEDRQGSHGEGFADGSPITDADIPF